MWGKKLEVASETSGDQIRIYKLSGNLFGSTEGYRFQDEVRETIGQGVKKVVIDVAGVERIDSSGVGILVTIMWSASSAGTALVLSALSTKVEKVLSIAMLLDHIDHAGSVEEAIKLVDTMKPRKLGT